MARTVEQLLTERENIQQRYQERLADLQAQYHQTMTLWASELEPVEHHLLTQHDDRRVLEMRQADILNISPAALAELQAGPET